MLEPNELSPRPRRFWPIHNHEFKKILSMFCMLFLIAFVYHILRNIKDTLVITAPGSGAEAILFLKIGGVIPFSILFMLFYIKLSNSLSKKNLFLVTILPFIIFFLLFIFILYPAKNYLQLTTFANKMRHILPLGFSGLISAIEHWTFSLFYVFAELWGNFVLSLLFWGLANDIMKVSEAKRFYVLFILGANIALYIAGSTTGLINGLATKDFTPDHWQVPLTYLMLLIVTCGIFVILLYNWINKNVLDNILDRRPAKTISKNTPKPSLKNSLQYLMRSPYILYIAILAISNNIIINLTEVIWKHNLLMQFPLETEFSNFMARYQQVLAVVTVLMLFVSHHVLRKFSWKTAAFITPFLFLISSLCFFSFIFFKEALTPFAILLGTTPLMITVIFGTMQSILCKATKYSFFDPCKEMAYIPLDQESKVKGKAAIDTVCSRLGKAGGAGIQAGLVTILGTLTATMPYVGVFILFTIAIWMWAIKQLDNELLNSEENDIPTKLQVANPV